MIKSELSHFLELRLQNIEELDKKLYPLKKVKQSESWVTLNSFLSTVLLNQPSSEKPTVIAEIKKKSPSLGSLTDTDALSLCRKFVSGGAHAISVLVDNVNFGGSPADLEVCTKAFSAHVFLYKDFVMSEYQVYLARALGASNILLMTQVLDDKELENLYHLALSIGIEPFIEVHDREQFDRALMLKPKIIGINARDFSIKGFPINLNNAGHLLHPFLEKNLWNNQTLLVAQSGIDSEVSYNKVCDNCPQGFPHAVQIGSSVSQTGGLPTWLF